MNRNIFLLTLVLLFACEALIAQQPSGLPAYTSTTPVNFIRTWTATAPVSTPEALIQGNLQQTKEATQYFDGLGRPLQTVVKKGSLVTNASDIQDTTGALDLVTPVLYDDFGREQYKFLPFAANNAGSNISLSDGQFKLNPFAQQQQFMSGRYGGQAESNFYSQTLFEASPLNRVLEQFAPGKSWAGTATQTSEADRHSIKTKYWINTDVDAVRIWDVTDANPGTGSGAAAATITTSSYNGGPELKATQSITLIDGFSVPAGSTFRAYITTAGTTTSAINSSYASTRAYPAGELYKNVTADEQNRQVIEFKDKEGRLVLKKVQLDNTVADDGSGRNHNGWLCTYYIYDDLGNLRCVIQPEGIKAMATAGNWALTDNLLKEQCFRYEYDGRQRMIIKQVPGAAEVFMVYDVRDRLVMTQDGNLRGQQLWNYTQYDGLNRPVKSGLFSSSTEGQTAHESSAMALSGDDNALVQYPTTTMLTNGYASTLTETYYDTYDWIPAAAGFDGAYNATADGYLKTASDTEFPYPQTNQKDNRSRGMVTGTKTNILGTGTYLYTTTIYDNKARPIQVKSLNQTGGVDMITTQYSWSGQPLVVISSQSKGGTNPQTTTTITTNDYDALGRLVKTSKKIANSLINNNALSTEKIIAVNKYDALGQLANKTLGAADANGAAGTETQAYEYNIRGWLLGMNRGYAQNSTNTNNFGFELNYDQYPGYGGSTGSLYYTGNIGGMTWRGKQNGSQIRRYNFSYDNANRILNADFLEASGSAFIKTTTDFSSQMGDGSNVNSAYDYNGNILAMTQKGLISANNSPVIDQLSYAYRTGSNKLAKVTEAAMNTAAYQLGDFNDGTNADDDYDYDLNGNLTKDQNKNISSISYNILNLPEYIAVAGKGAISYQYDATGNRLQKKVTEGSTTKITDYLGGSIFENNVLQHVAMEEGRLRPSGSSFIADYMLKDHLGNVRSLVAEDGTLLEESAYYPFGLKMSGISLVNATPSLQNKNKTFQGQKFDDDLDLNYYSFKYRNHDPQIGRFTEIDPLASDYVYNSTYAFSENKVIIHVELEGLETAAALPAQTATTSTFYPGTAHGNGGDVNLFPNLDHNVKVLTENILYKVLMPVVVTAGKSRGGFFQRLFSAVASLFAEKVLSDSGGKAETTNNEGSNGSDTKVPSGARTEPGDLQEQLTLEEAKGGAGEPIMQGKLKDPKYDSKTGTHDKIQHNHDHGDGTSTEVHYDRDRKTGEGSGYKIKDDTNKRSRGNSSNNND